MSVNNFVKYNKLNLKNLFASSFNNLGDDAAAVKDSNSFEFTCLKISNSRNN